MPYFLKSFDEDFYTFILQDFKNTGNGSIPSAELLFVLRDTPEVLQESLENGGLEKLVGHFTIEHHAVIFNPQEGSRWVVSQLKVDLADVIAELPTKQDLVPV